MAPTGCDDTLDPGDETTCSGSYTLTQDDVNQGVASNSAFASGGNAQGLTINSGTIHCHLHRHRCHDID